MELLDNYLPVNQFRELQSIFLGPNFPWFYNDCINLSTDPGGYQFVHSLYSTNKGPSSNYYNLVAPIIEKLSPESILIRVKCNLNPRTNDHVVLGGYHTDIPTTQSLNFKTAIFYLNTNNGYTKFETGEKVQSVENRMLLFYANEKHTGVSCTDKNRRVVMNINYVEINA